MRSAFVVAFTVTAGCLPAYDNQLPASTGDMGVQDSGPGTDGPSCNPSGKLIQGITFSAETGLATAGVQGYLEGYQDPRFVSMPSDSLGHLSFDIPDCVFSGPAPRYLIMDDTASSPTPVVRTWTAPAKFGKEELPEGTALHFLEEPADPALSKRGEVAKELVAAGLVASVADFKSKYSFLFSGLISVAGQITRYNGYSVQIVDNGTTLDNTGCNMPGKLDTQCCVFYFAGVYLDYKAGRFGPNLLALNDTKASGTEFIVTCPTGAAAKGTIAKEVTLNQTQPTSSLYDSFSNPPNADFAPIVVPIVPAEAVAAEWFIYQ